MFWRSGALSIIPSIVITSLFLIYLWSWLNPADFWQRLVALIVTIIVGAGTFVGLVFLFSLLAMLLFGIRLRRTIRKKMDKMMEGYE